MHWRIPPHLLRPYVPRHSKLKLDIYDGSAWISLVPFTVSGLHIRLMPPMPGFSSFSEMNLRTYVTDGHKPGALFLDIYADKLVPVLFHYLAGLPYRRADIKVQSGCVQYKEDNTAKGNLLHLKWLHDGAAFPGTELDRWLTDRYCTYQQNGNHIYRFPIHHADWPLQHISVEDSFVSFKWNDIILTTGSMELLHYSPGVDTLFWMKQKLR